jgi:protein TonB
MNIQNYILPVSTAAAVHVALLCMGTREPHQPFTKIAELSLAPLPPKPADMVAKDEEKEDTNDPVVPLAGGPQSPSIDDPPVTPKPTDITIPRDEQSREYTANLPAVPPITGFDGGPLTAGSRVPSGPFTAIQLDRIPRATVQQPPDYPATMHQNGITGSVTVEFEVDTEGRVIRAEAIHYTHREFAGPAVRAVLQWRFEPGKRNGRPVPFRMAIPIEFSLPAE